jgi:hypothetical protein
LNNDRILSAGVLRQAALYLPGQGRLYICKDRQRQDANRNNLAFRGGAELCKRLGVKNFSN